MPELMREDVSADDRLGARDRPTGGVGHEARQWAQAKRIDAGAPGRRVAKRHDDLFQSRIARPFAKSKHGDAGAGGAGAKRRERVGGGEAKIVMTMELKREICLLAHAPHRLECAERIEQAERIGKAQPRRALRRRGAGDAADVARIRARGVLRRRGRLKGPARWRS